MLIFDLVPPALVGVFFAVSVVAALVHRASRSPQKIPMTFLMAVTVVLWLGNEPWAEPFPGAIKTILIIATISQIIMAALAYWVREKKPTHYCGGQANKN